MPRVAICAVAQSKYVRDRWQDRFQGMCWEVVEDVVRQTGLDLAGDDIGAVVTNSDDFFDCRTISDNAITDVVGAHYKGEEKVAQDGAQAVYYGYATAASGQADVVLVAGHSKESQVGDRNLVTHAAFDPFYTRPVGLDYLSAAALEAEAFMRRFEITDADLAELVSQQRVKAARNPLANETTPITPTQAVASPMLADPIRAAYVYPPSDGAVALILATEKRARQLTDRPVWITGLGSCIDSFFLGDRDLSESLSLRRAAERAYRMAGIETPSTAFDICEISDPYAHQLPLWAWQLGLTDDPKRWLKGDLAHVNPSGGTLAGTPQVISGLARTAEAVLQLRGDAGTRQIAGARRALAHGTTGPAGQQHCVITLAS
ncbi:MAG TPA: thiolase family protein [Planctomycetaceae bacterium]|jgi:acetyl-CoA C-acetyltransferase|nr:thiolase family protein [Planctomycetaceae bacterium]